MKYFVSYEKPHRHYIDIQFEVEDISTDELIIRLPAWRPGRYELGNFAKNIQKWQAFNELGEKLSFQKIAKDAWMVQTEGASKIVVKYNYFANEINAGSSFLDETQLYVNPVNCFLYVEEKMHEECELHVAIPSQYKIAISLAKKDENSYTATHFHELVDSPFIASDSLKHKRFVLDNICFNVWFQGDCLPNFMQLINDFFIFIDEQMRMMKEFPVNEFHFIFQILPYPFYHGVEHLKSTVLALGPGSDINKKELYDELLGVCSHELFHCWNVKSIRPKDMLPYNYSKENYSRLGYVYEGVTTYYGDLMLHRSRLFSDEEYFNTFNVQLQKHFDNFGRKNYSVADSSFDTWLDGYVPGVPNRKVSIYTEGCLVAFLMDVYLLKITKNTKSLDDVMRALYYDFAKKGIGYTASDYKKIIENLSGEEWSGFFDRYVFGTEDLSDALAECMNYIGLEMVCTPSKKTCERKLGIKTIEDGANTKVSLVYPDSISDAQGIGVGDLILSVNQVKVTANLNELLDNFATEKILELNVANLNKTKTLRFELLEENYFHTYQVRLLAEVFEEQRANFRVWSGQKEKEN